MYAYNESEKLEHLEKECPHCQELVLEIAVKCRHCGEFIEDIKKSFVNPFDTPHRTQKENYMHALVSTLLQLLGLALLIYGFVKLHTPHWPAIMFPCGILFWMIGAIGIRWKKCSNCGCAIANKDISKCPRCYFEFSA